MKTPRPHFLYPSVVPDLPEPATYLPLLQEMHERHWYSNFGPLVRQFEHLLLASFGRPGETCVTACNATAGLSAALLATGRTGPVLLPAFTFPASLGAVRAAGMNPIVLDIDVEDWTLSVPLLAAALAGTRDAVVMLTAPFGLNRSFSAHLALCKYYGAPVVIDNAAGLGPPRLATKPDSRVFEVFSMHATKPFGIGEGCAVFACADHDADLREALSFALGTYGHSETVSWGFNGKMSEMHAAVGLAQLDRFQGRMERRQAFAAEYLRRLAPLPGLTCRYAMSDSPWQFFPILLPNTQTTERFIERAGSVGVEIRRYYRPSLSRWPEAKCGSPCPVSEDLADRMCALPIRAAQGRADIDVIVNLIEAALRETLFNVCGREA